MQLEDSDGTVVWLGALYDGDPFTTIFVKMVDGTVYTIKSIASGTGIIRWKAGETEGRLVPDVSMVLTPYE